MYVPFDENIMTTQPSQKLIQTQPCHTIPIPTDRRVEAMFKTQ